MPYSTPPTLATGTILTSAYLNTYLRSNFRYMKGQDGPITLEDILGIYVSSTAANATAALYLGDSAGTVRAGVWGQRNGSNAGGRLIGLTLDDSGVLREGWRLDHQQRMGIGTDSPLFRLHVRDGSTPGNVAFWVGSNINATPQTILPTSAGATLAGALGVVGGNSLGPQLRAEAALNSSQGSVDVYNNSGGGQRVTITLSGGGVTIARTNGSDTYRAALLVFWS